jgi:hypothetical protein
MRQRRAAIAAAQTSGLPEDVVWRGKGGQGVTEYRACAAVLWTGSASKSRAGQRSARVRLCSCSKGGEVTLCLHVWRSPARPFVVFKRAARPARVRPATARQTQPQLWNRAPAPKNSTPRPCGRRAMRRRPSTSPGRSVLRARAPRLQLGMGARARLDPTHRFGPRWSPRCASNARRAAPRWPPTSATALSADSGADRRACRSWIGSRGGPGRRPPRRASRGGFACRSTAR